jgi:hypothetical protein
MVIKTLQDDQIIKTEDETDLPDDTDLPETYAEEYEKWKVRELRRVMKAREERAKIEEERLEVERR